MPNVMAALPNTGGALCSTPQSLPGAHYRVKCSNTAKTRNPLKCAGVPQTRQQISAASGPKFTILCKYVEKVLLFNKIFSDCRYMPQLRRFSPINLYDGVPDGDLLRHLCVLYFQRAACSTFQTCILNSH